MRTCSPVPTLKRTLVGALCLGLQPLAMNALSVPAMAYIVHRMGPEGYARWAAATALLAVFAVLTNLGLRGAFVRGLAAEPASVGTALAEQLGLRLSLTAPVGLLVLLVCAVMGYPASVLWCTAISVVGLVLTTAATTLGDVAQSFHRIKTLAMVNVVSGAALTAVSVVVAWKSPTPERMAAAYLTGPAIMAVMLLVVVRRDICAVTLRWDAARFGALLKRSRHFGAQQLLFSGSNQVEGLLCPRLLGLETFGPFAAGAVLGNRLAALPDALCAAAYPAMVQLFGRDRRAGARAVLWYLAIAVAGGIAAAAVGMVIAGPLGRLLMPDHADRFAFVARVTIWSIPLFGMELVMGYGLNAAGRDAIQARLALPAATLSLAVSVALVVAWGLEGACWSMVARPALRAAFLAPAAVATFWVEGRAEEPAARVKERVAA